MADRTIQTYDALMIEAKRAPMISRAEEQQLARRARAGDRQAGDRIVMAHLRVALAEARKTPTRGVCRDELAMQGVLGLIEAAKRFDPDTGVRFVTFARHWVKSRIIEYAMHNAGAVKIGTTAPERRLYFGLNRIRRRHGIEPGRALTRAEAEVIAAELRTRPDYVQAMDNRSRAADSSLDAPVRADDSTTTFGALLPDPNAIDPEAGLIARQTRTAHREALAAALARLPDREREILRARRLRERPLTLQALSERFRVSRERIRQLENNALRKLGADLRASAPELDGALPDPASVDLYQVPQHGTAAQA